MKTSKLIIYNIIVALAILNSIFIYIGSRSEFTESFIEFLSLNNAFLFTFASLFLIQIMVNASFIVTSAIKKKNLLRVSLIINAFLLIISIYARILEIKMQYSCVACYWITIFYGALFIINVLLLKELHTLVQKLFHKKD